MKRPRPLPSSELLDNVRNLIAAWGDIHEWTNHLPTCQMLADLPADLPCNCGLMACYDKGHGAFARLILAPELNPKETA